MKHLISMILFIVMVFQTVNLLTMVHPVMASLKKENRLQLLAIKNGLGDPGEKILQAITLASRQTDLPEELLLSLMYSESSFQPKAVSSKQYQGLMQIPQKVHYPDANCLIGARIFLEKLKVTDGDYRKAIIIYKGWNIDHPEGKRQADKVLALARKLKEG